MIENDVIKAFEEYNKRLNAVIKFLIDEVLTGRQSERLIDELDPSLKNKQLDILNDFIKNSKFKGTDNE